MNFFLQAKLRETSKKARKALRQDGMIPAVLYGHGIKSQNLSLAKKIFEKIYHQIGESTIIDVEVEGGRTFKALIQAIDRHPTTSDILHVDLYQIRMDEKISHDVPLNYIGESKAIKEMGGILVKNLSNLPIRCLPGDLPSDIQVDISSLVDFDAHITIADIKVPKGVEILAKPEEVLALVEPPRSEEELKALDEKVEENVEAVTKVEKEKKEEEVEVEAAAPEAKKAESKPDRK